MTVFRLVDFIHDPIGIGEYLTRIDSPTNRQKLGRGMYFAMSRESALAFNETRRHHYSHLLTCEIVGCQLKDFVDLSGETKAIAMLKRDKKLQTRKANEAFCLNSGKKGLIATQRDWQEICLLEQYVSNSVRITACEELSSTS